MAPIFWTDNDVTLFGAQTATLEAAAPLGDGAPLAVEVEGFNLAGPLRISLD